MATVAEVLARYRADTSSYVSQVRSATAATNEFAAAMPRAEQAQSGLSASSVALGAAMGTLGAMVFAKASAAIKQYAMQGIQAAAQYEQTVISMQGIFVGSGMSMQQAADKTKTYLAELRRFAAETPFELPQTLDAVKRLLSIGYTADDVKNRLLPTIGDMVAALGQPPAAISAVVYAFGQMKSAGRVLGQDLMQIGNALPGFNAKMALVNEMFGGDAVAAQKAFDRGLVDSETAIGVLIKAMQKFPGAAGAMERQSKSLNGVISTFKDEVNNALIDGIYPYIEGLSTALSGVIPAVKSTAEAFGNQLGPMLIQGANLMSAFVPVVTAVIPPLLSMASATGGLVMILNALAPVAAVIGTALGAMANAFNALPAPVRNMIGVLIALRLIMARLPIDFAKLKAGAIASMMSVKASFVGAMDTVRLSMMMAGTSTKMFGVNIRMMAAGAKAAFTGIVASARAMMAGIGPIGWALLAASVAMELFMGRTNEAQQEMQAFGDTLTYVNGKLDENSVALLNQKLQQDGVYDSLQKAGVSTSEYLAALTQGGPALDAMRDRLSGISREGTRLVSTGKAAYTVVSDQARAANSALESLNTYAGTLSDAAQGAQQEADALAGLNGATTTATSSLEDMNRAKLQAAQQSMLLTAAELSAKNAVSQLNTMYEILNKTISNQASHDAAVASIASLKKSLDENGKSLSINTEKGRANRAAIRDSAQAYLNWAQTIQDPIKRQDALKKGYEKIADALKGKGIDPASSPILKSFKKQMDKSGEMVDKWKADAAKAKDAGLDVGRNFIAGIVESLKAGEQAAYNASAAVGRAVNAGAADATETASPSKVAMRIGGYFTEGLALGIEGGIARVNSAISKMFGSLPTAPSMMERLLGDKSSKFSETHAKELTQLGGNVEKLNSLTEKIKAADEALAALNEGRQSLATYFEGRLGAPGEWDALRESVKKGEATVSDFLSMHDQLADLIQKSTEGQGAKGMARGRFLMDQLDAYTESLNRLSKRRDALAKDLEKAKQEVEDAKAIQSELNGLLAAPLGQPNEIQKSLNVLSTSVDSIVSTFERLRDVVMRRLASRGGERDALVSSLEASSKRLIELAKRRDELTTKLADAQQKLDSLKSDRDSMAKSIRDGLMGLMKAEGGIRSADEYITGLRQRLEATREFVKNMRVLQSRGLDQGTIDQILSLGAKDGGALAASLATSSDAQLAEINAMQKEAGLLTSEYGDQQADRMYGSAIKQAQSYVAGLQSQRDSVLAEMQGIVDGINQQMTDLAGDTGAGSVLAAELMAAGFQSQYEGVVTEMANITQGLSDTLYPLIDKSFDTGQDFVIRMRKGFRHQARGLIDEVERTANAIGRAMAKATGENWTDINIDKSFLSGGIDKYKGQKYDRQLFNAAAYPAMQAANKNGDLVIEQGGIQIKIEGAANMTPKQLSEALSKAVQDALSSAAKTVNSGRR